MELFVLPSFPSHLSLNELVRDHLKSYGSGKSAFKPIESPGVGCAHRSEVDAEAFGAGTLVAREAAHSACGGRLTSFGLNHLIN